MSHKIFTITAEHYYRATEFSNPGPLVTKVENSIAYRVLEVAMAACHRYFEPGLTDDQVKGITAYRENDETGEMELIYRLPDDSVFVIFSCGGASAVGLTQACGVICSAWYTTFDNHP